MIRVLLWDVDGTLLNFHESEKAAIRSGFEAFSLGICTDAMLAEYSAINRRHWEALERGEMTKPQILTGRFAEFFENHGIDTALAADFNAHFQLALGDTICFFPHALETLRALKGRVLQCAVTNGTKTAQEKKLRRSGMDELFDHIFISEDVGFEKPSPAFFDRVFSVIGEERRAESMIIGDSLTSDMRGGNNAGIRTCRFNPGGAPNDTDVRVDHEIGDIAEVMALIGV